MSKRTCRDGGTCHHYCFDGECFREECCVPLTGYDGPWGSTPKSEKVSRANLSFLNGIVFGVPPVMLILSLMQLADPAPAMESAEPQAGEERDSDEKP